MRAAVHIPSDDNRQSTRAKFYRLAHSRIFAIRGRIKSDEAQVNASMDSAVEPDYDAEVDGRFLWRNDAPHDAMAIDCIYWPSSHRIHVQDCNAAARKRWSLSVDLAFV